MAQAHVPWLFDEITRQEPNRASALETAGSTSELIKAVVDSLRHELALGSARFGNEHALNNPADIRAVVQFHVGANLFDWFANARTGYRAQFRHGWEIGLAFNRELVLALREVINEALPSVIAARELRGEFEECGRVEVTKSVFAASLTPDLSKVWFCTKLIGLNGGTSNLPSGLVGPRLTLSAGATWPAPYRDGADSWLELKGAFLGSEGPYQPKTPEVRAKKLESTGEA